MAAARPPQTTCTVCRDSLTTLVPEPTLIIIRIREYNQMLYPWRAEVRHNFDITLGLKVRVALAVGSWPGKLGPLAAGLRVNKEMIGV